MPRRAMGEAFHGQERAIKERVRLYYEATTEDYLKYYETDWHHHMHYGFNRNLPKGGNPTEHMVRHLAALASVTPSDVVLDAGCGVGGSSIWLAGNLGCRCIGITLAENQARLAHGFAAKRKVGGKTRFLVNDFTRTAFAEGRFDVVWALESFDHAPNKRAWVADMFRVLRPGGRLVIADGFSEGRALDPKQAAQYGHFLSGWAVPHLCTAAQLESYGRDAGFLLSHAEDVTADVMPHARAIYRFGILFIPWRWIRHKMGFTSAEKLGNALATYYQFKTLRQGFWSYRIFCFRKPAARPG